MHGCHLNDLNGAIEIGTGDPLLELVDLLTLGPGHKFSTTVRDNCGALVVALLVLVHVGSKVEVPHLAIKSELLDPAMVFWAGAMILFEVSHFVPEKPLYEQGFS